MTKVLIIYFNDQTKLKNQEKASFLKTMTELGKANSIAVNSIEEFKTLMTYLPSTQLVYVFIHIMSNYLLEDANADFPGKTWAISLATEFERCSYTFVTSDNSKNSAEIVPGKKAFNINDLMQGIFVTKNSHVVPQTVGDILGISVSSVTQIKAPKVDFAIITALFEDELTAVHNVFNLNKDDSTLNGKTIYSGTVYNGKKKVIAIHQTNTGMADASALAAEVISEYNPRYIFMTGVCGGDEKQGYGDIMVAKFVFTITKGKVTDEGFLRELEFVKIDELTIRRITEERIKVLNDVMVDLIRNQDQNKHFSKFSFQDLKCKIEPMACSNVVIDKQNYFSDVIKAIDRKAASVEMESYGIARTCETMNNGLTKAVIIKGVMDNTTAKTDEAKEYAATTSALYLKHLLEQGIII